MESESGWKKKKSKTKGKNKRWIWDCLLHWIHFGGFIFPLVYQIWILRYFRKRWGISSRSILTASGLTTIIFTYLNWRTWRRTRRIRKGKKVDDEVSKSYTTPSTAQHLLSLYFFSIICTIRILFWSAPLTHMKINSINGYGWKTILTSIWKFRY